jgi:hypothetical protein
MKDRLPSMEICYLWKIFGYELEQGNIDLQAKNKLIG